VSGGPPGEQVPGPWVVPKDFKRAIVHPVYKGSSKPGAEPGSYRPVSILTELSKVLEVVVKEALEAHLDPTQILSRPLVHNSPGNSARPLDGCREGEEGSGHTCLRPLRGV
jgi:hypothetical protein